MKLLEVTQFALGSQKLFVSHFYLRFLMLLAGLTGPQRQSTDTVVNYLSIPIARN
jgi:hypothetical protein